MALDAYGALENGLDSVVDYLAEALVPCLVTAFIIAGAIMALIKKEAILRYLGPDVKKTVSLPLASISGTVLAVCSCTILPLFAGLYRKGSGIGPATAFLYSGPAINILAIAYTAQQLGYDLGLARAVAAISLALVVGLTMSLVFRMDDEKKSEANRKKKKMMAQVSSGNEDGRPGWAYISFFFLLVGILVVGTAKISWYYKYSAIPFLILGVVYITYKYFTRDEVKEWGYETWDLTKMIFPILIAGTFVIGVIAYAYPPENFQPYLGDNSFISNFYGAIIGAVLYMPTLLEVPLIGTTFGYTSGNMGEGPALALLLAGPAISLPNMIVLYRLMGLKKSSVYIGIVIIVSTMAGFIYGNFVV